MAGAMAHAPVAACRMADRRVHSPRPPLRCSTKRCRRRWISRVWRHVSDEAGMQRLLSRMGQKAGCWIWVGAWAKGSGAAWHSEFSRVQFGVPWRMGELCRWRGVSGGLERQHKRRDRRVNLGVGVIDMGPLCAWEMIYGPPRKVELVAFRIGNFTRMFAVESASRTASTLIVGIRQSQRTPFQGAAPLPRPSPISCACHPMPGRAKPRNPASPSATPQTPTAKPTCRRSGRNSTIGTTACRRRRAPNAKACRPSPRSHLRQVPNPAHAAPSAPTCDLHLPERLRPRQRSGRHPFGGAPKCLDWQLRPGDAC